MRYFIVLAFLVLIAVSASADDSQDRRQSGGSDERHIPKVFDAQGKLVGPLAGSSGGDGVYLNVGGEVVFAAIARQTSGTQVSATQWQWATTGFIPYASSDCSGPPLMFYYSGVYPSMAVRQGVDVVLYIASGEYSTTVHASSLRANPNIDQCTTYSYDLPVFLVDPSGYALTQHYPEPLTIRY
jgi:hypothetical protein